MANIGAMKWLAILISLVYFLLPQDLIPDFLLGWGWLDDILLIYLIWYYYRRFSGVFSSRGGVHSSGYQDYSTREETRGHQDNYSNTTGATHSPPPDPYAVLGLQPGASQEEIKRAYRKLALQFHPDKMAHLGEEFQALAEKRFKEIQEAYRQLTGE